ncbi:MAG TPA: protein kinase [Burkholderiales bacterium]|nr:protein kinase [Burkholderiales bacterium]
MDESASRATENFRSRFEIKRELGRGGMGEVYLAHDTYTQRDVAIKLAKLQLLEDPEVGARVKRMWLNETRLAGKLRHPHIVEIYEAGVTEEFGYLVMEYVEGGTLRQHVRPDTLLPVATVVEAIYKVCNALEYANTLGLLHRDIKPANVMLTAQRDVKVADFGTCYLANADETQVFDVGTLPYMPPEHFKMRPPTLQSDLYAVGVMTYQLLTAALPFNATSFQAMIHEKLHEDFVPLEARRRDLPAELRFAVHRAIHRDPEIRYASWKAFCDDLALAQPQLSRPREIEYESARFDALKKLAFFSGFPDAQLWETIRISRWLDVPADSVIFEEGAESRSLYVIVRGDVAVTRAGTTLNRLGPGECFGELAYLDEERPRRSATVRSRTRLMLIEIEAEALRHASEALQAAFHRALMKVMVKRIRHADKRVLELLSGHS